MSKKISNTVGDIFILASQVEQYRGHAIGYLAHRLYPSISKKMFILLQDKNDNPIGFVSWTFMSRERLDFLTDLNGGIFLEESDYNTTGEVCFFTEFMSADPFVMRNVKVMAKHIRKMYPNFKGDFLGNRLNKDRVQRFRIPDWY